MGKIAVIGLCGKSVFMPVDHFHAKGETVIAEDMHEEMGGKGFNQAIAASKMGAQVSFLAATGDDDTSEKCRKVLEDNGVTPVLIEKAGLCTTIAFILTDKSGENRVTEYKGAELSADDVSAFADYIKEAEILMIQNEVPHEVNEAAIKIASENNVKIIYNPAPARKADSNMLKNIFLVTPNEHEASYIEYEKAENYIITLGSNGCTVNGETHIDSIPVKAVDTTGAGDTFNGVLAAYLTENMTLAEAAHYATVASGLGVTKKYVIDAIPTKNEIEEILNTQGEEQWQ